MSKETVLLTGGTGYIGSHTCVELIEAGYQPVLIDNLSNSSEAVLDRIAGITGVKPAFIKADITDETALKEVFQEYRFSAVIHFAGLKAVGESVEDPLLYYRNNVAGTCTLMKQMAESGVKDIVFSSSCTVYGNPAEVPVTEESPLGAVNPYGRSKLMIEEMMRDQHTSDNTWNVILLRYFNPIGAHPTGKLGEDPTGIPNNLLPYVARAAAGEIEKVSVYGTDYDTRDGSGIRDYIHIMDLAEAHLKALKKLKSEPGVLALNLGRGEGYSVLEVISAFEKASNKRVPWQAEPRRTGDAVEVYADPSLAVRVLDWKAGRDLAEMCRDTWKWQQG